MHKINYDKKLKESLITTIRLMKSIGILDANYKEDSSKITLEKSSLNKDPDSKLLSS